jgi:hypothetical protein
MRSVVEHVHVDRRQLLQVTAMVEVLMVVAA